MFKILLFNLFVCLFFFLPAFYCIFFKIYFFCFSDPHPSDNQKKQRGPRPLKNEQQQQQKTKISNKKDWIYESISFVPQPPENWVDFISYE